MVRSTYSSSQRYRILTSRKGVSGSICELLVLLAETLCLYPSRPTGGVAALLLFFFLNLNPHPRKTWREHSRQFDFVGLILIVSGVVCLLIGFNFSETSCKSYIIFQILTEHLILRRATCPNNRSGCFGRRVNRWCSRV